MAELLRFGIETSEVVSAVILHLQSVRGEQRFAVTEILLHPVLIPLKKRFIAEILEQRLGDVHRENQSDPFLGAQRFAVVIVVQILKQKTLEEGAHFSGDFAEIDRTAQHYGIHFVNSIQHGSQFIAQYTAVRAGLLFEFACHAALAAAEFEVV